MGKTHWVNLALPRRSGAAHLLLTTLVLSMCAILIGGCDNPMSEPVPTSNPTPQNSPNPSAIRTHRLMIGLTIANFDNGQSLLPLVSGFDAFIYGHPGAHEDLVHQLQERGLESFRYFNVFHTDPLFAKWGGYYTDLFNFLTRVHGWIPGVSYRYFSNPRDPDRIIDHTRSEVTAGVVDRITHWAESIPTDRIFLDVTFDELSDWMIAPGEHWPWPPSAHEEMNRRWRRNMQNLVDRVDEAYPVMINGSVRLKARSVLYENQVWNHRRGWSRWEDLVKRMVRRDTIPALHVGHSHLRPWEIPRGERLTLAVWLLADQSYLLVEPEGRPLEWAHEIQAAGFQRFVPTGPAVEVGPNVWRREGTIDGDRWMVMADLPNEFGQVERLSE